MEADTTVLMDAAPATIEELRSRRAQISQLRMMIRALGRQLDPLTEAETMASLWEIFLPERGVKTLCFPATDPLGTLGIPKISFLNESLSRSGEALGSTIELADQFRDKLHHFDHERFKAFNGASIDSTNWPSFAQALCPAQFPAWMARLERREMQVQTPESEPDQNPRSI